MSSVEDIIDALITDDSPPNECSNRNSDKTALWIESLYERFPFEDTFWPLSLCRTYHTRVQPLVHSIVQEDSNDGDETKSAMLRLAYLDSFLSLVFDKNVSSSNGSIVSISSENSQVLFADVLTPVFDDVMKVSLHVFSPLFAKLRLFLLRWMQLALTHRVRPDSALKGTLRSWTCRLLAASSALANVDDVEVPFFSSLDPMLYFDASIKDSLAQCCSLDLSALLSTIVRHLQTPNVASHSRSVTPFVPVWQQLHALVLQVTGTEEELHDEDNHATYWQQTVLELLDNDDQRSMTKAMIQWVYPPPEPPSSSGCSLHLGHLQSSSTIVPSPEIAPDNETFSLEQRLQALLQFFHLSTISPKSFEMHWIPLIFAWLQSSRDAEVQTAILILDRWLQRSNDVNDVVWSNLCTILQRLRKIHRRGWTLIWLGWLERRLFHYGFSRGILESKRISQSLQEWLIILDRNNRHYTQDHLIYGLLCVVAPFLYDCVHLYTSLSSGIDLGRLGLSSLLPILEGAAGYGEVWQSHAADEASNDAPLALSIMVHFLTLASLSNLLIFSYPIMTRHAGKLVCNVFLFIRRLDDCEAQFGKSLRQCALQVGMRTVILCGDAADILLKRIVQDDQYDQCTVDIVDSILLALPPKIVLRKF
jgi:hypothetical protein